MIIAGQQAGPVASRRSAPLMSLVFSEIFYGETLFYAVKRFQIAALGYYGCAMTFTHHGLQVELSDECWADAEMAGFVPVSRSYRAEFARLFTYKSGFRYITAPEAARIIHLGKAVSGQRGNRDRYSWF